MNHVPDAISPHALTPPMPPIIVIGMHRSGTSVLSRLLDDLGVLVGERVDDNHESTFFQSLNRWMFGQMGSEWHNPDAVDFLLEHAEVRRHVLDYLRTIVDSPQVREYLGRGGYRRYGSLAALDRPWSWKDPRNTFTLPIWLDLFPQARVIHITRHGVDVAQSLRARCRRTLEMKVAEHRRYQRLGLYRVRRKRGGFTDAVRCEWLDEGIRLWERYVQRAAAHVASLGDRALDLRFEDLAAEPAGVLRRVAGFCGIEASDDWIAKVAGRVRPERSLSYRQDTELISLAERHAASLAAVGYGLRDRAA